MGHSVEPQHSWLMLFFEVLFLFKQAHCIKIFPQFLHRICFVIQYIFIVHVFSFLGAFRNMARYFLYATLSEVLHVNIHLCTACFWCYCFSFNALVIQPLSWLLFLDNLVNLKLLWNARLILLIQFSYAILTSLSLFVLQHWL